MLIFDSLNLMLYIVWHDYTAWRLFVSLQTLNPGFFNLMEHIVLLDYIVWHLLQFWRQHPIIPCLIFSMNLTNFERLINYVCIFLLYIPNVEVGSDASKLYDKRFDPSSKGINTHENANEHEIISLIQLSESRRCLQIRERVQTQMNTARMRLKQAVKNLLAKYLLSIPGY